MTAKITFIKATDHQSMIIQVNNRKIARFSINNYSIHWILDSDSICLVKCSHNQQFLACIDIQHIRIVNMQNGSHDRIINHNHTEKVHSAAISHNNQMIATASWDNRVHVIDIANNTVIANLPHSFDCNDVDFTLDDSHVITAADTRNVDRWCIETGLFVHTITSHDEWVIKSNVAPNGRHMISQCKNQVKVIDLQEDTVIYTKTCQSREMIDVVFSHDCSMYFLKTTNNTIEGWMISSGQRCFSRTLPSISITSMAIDQSGQIIYIGTSSGSIMCWNISTDTIEATIDAYFMQTDRPNHRDNDTGTTMVITGPMQSYPSQTLGVHTAAVRHLAYDSGGRWIASASSDGSACLWPTDQPEQQAQRLVHHSRVRRVAVAGDGSTFSAADDGVLRVWDATGLCRREIDTSGGWITELMICAADTLAVTISRDRAIRWWSLGDGMLLGCSAPGTIMPCDQAAATSDGRVVFWCGEHSLHRIALEADGSTTAAHIAPDGGLSASAIDPDRGCIATGSRDGTVRVWQWGGKRACAGAAPTEGADHQRGIQWRRYHAGGGGRTGEHRRLARHRRHGHQRDQAAWRLGDADTVHLRRPVARLCLARSPDAALAIHEQAVVPQQRDVRPGSGDRGRAQWHGARLCRWHGHQAYRVIEPREAPGSAGCATNTGAHGILWGMWRSRRGRGSVLRGVRDFC